MKQTVKTAHIVLFVTLILTASAIADTLTRTIPFCFSPGNSLKVFKGSIRGYETIDYRVKASAGHILAVRLLISNPSGYFNVTASGSQNALFIGSIYGPSFKAKLRRNGLYDIQVYLMRNAARRGSVASYELTISVH